MYVLLVIVCCLSVFRRDLRSDTPFHLTYLSALRPVPYARFLYPCLLHHISYALVLLGKCLNLNIIHRLSLRLYLSDAGVSFLSAEVSVIIKLLKLILILNALIYNINSIAKYSVIVLVNTFYVLLSILHVYNNLLFAIRIDFK